MVGRYKRTKRTVKRSLLTARNGIAAVVPGPLRRRLAPAVRLGDMLLLDHLFVRVLFPNRHRISHEAWRAAQPLPYQIKTIKDLGVRTVVNLRGPSATTTYRAERAECERLGLTYVDYRLRSRAAPSREELLGLRELFSTISYPVILHCKSGADRAGLASAILQHVKGGVPIETARHQLSLRYGHIRQADTGILDDFFERYLRYSAERPMPFFEWVETVYDPDELKRTYTAKGWANRLVDGFLRRE